MSDVTRILSQINDGDPQAAEQLLPLVYDELRRLAAAKMAQEKPGQTLQATALVHEAYIRLVDVDKAEQWDSRGHFFAAAAEAMRRILVRHARSKGNRKARREPQKIDLDGLVFPAEITPTRCWPWTRPVTQLGFRGLYRRGDCQTSLLCRLVYRDAGADPRDLLENCLSTLGLRASVAVRRTNGRSRLIKPWQFFTTFFQCRDKNDTDISHCLIEQPHIGRCGHDKQCSKGTGDLPVGD